MKGIFESTTIRNLADGPFGPRLLSDSARVRRTRWHHFRPFNGHHTQISVKAPGGELALAMDDWVKFAGEIIGLLREGRQPEVWICPEIGPICGGYGLSAKLGTGGGPSHID